MRQKHMREAHPSHQPQPESDFSGLDDSIEPLLHHLVAENRVEDAKSVLSALANPDAYKIGELRMLASFAASPAMLHLLGEHYSQDDLSQCIIQSIKGRNETTMEYNLAKFQIPFRHGHGKADDIPLCQLLSTGWLEGLNMWCKASRRQVQDREFGKGFKNSRSEVLKRYLSDPRLLVGAAKHPAADEAVLFLWKESGLLAYISDIPDWAARNLRHVARLGLSVTLATELLERGASVNFQPGKHQRSPLHCAARNDSVAGAEMIRFLLLKGADPEAIVEVTVASEQREIKSIRDEKGARNIHEWLGKSWDELVEETKHIRNELQGGQSSKPEMTVGTVESVEHWSLRSTL